MLAGDLGVARVDRLGIVVAVAGHAGALLQQLRHLGAGLARGRQLGRAGLPIDLFFAAMGARLMPNDGPGEVRLKINDDGGGPFLRLDAHKLALNPGELGRLDRYSRALVWIFDAMFTGIPGPSAADGGPWSGCES